MTQLKEMPKDGRAVYFCPTCTAAYDDQREAQGCEAANSPTVSVKPGDILLGYDRYGWSDGLSHWTRKRKLIDDRTGYPWEKHEFFWVVTALIQNLELDRCYGQYFNCNPGSSHDVVASVHSLGINNGMPGGRRGFRSIAMMRTVKNVPKRVVKEAAALVGPIHKGYIS